MGGSDAAQTGWSAAIEDLAKRFDTTDLADEWEQMPEAQFEVLLKRSRHMFPVDEGLAAAVEQIAASRSLSAEALVEEWLREKVAEYAGRG